MPKTTRTVGLVLLGSFVVFCFTLYHYADLTPASAPRPNWVDASLPQWAGAKRPYQIGRMSPLPMPIAPEPSADGTAAPSHDIATDAARAAKVGAAESANAAQEQQAVQIEDRLQGARQRAAQEATADFDLEKRTETVRLAAENQMAIQAAAEAAAAEQARLAQIEADRQAAAAKEAAQEREAAQTEDRLQGARQRTAQRTTADLEQEKREEAARLAAEKQKTMQAEAAAAERARLAQIEADRQAAAAKEAAQEREAAQLEDRLQNARQREAQLTTADFELEKRTEAARLAAEKQKAIQAAAEATAAEQARLAQIETEKRAADAAVAERVRLAQIEADKQRAANAAENAAREQEAAQTEDRIQSARQRMAERATANFELEKRAETARLAAEKQRVIQAAAAAMAAEGARFARTEAERQAAAAAEAKNEAAQRKAAQIEDRLHGALQSAAKQATADFEHERRAQVDPIATGSIPAPITSLSVRAESGTASVGSLEHPDNPTDGAPARKDARAGQNAILERAGSGRNGQQAGVPLKDRNSNGAPRASVEASRPSNQGDHGTENVTGNAVATSAVAARANEPEGAPSRPILQRRCAAILKSPGEYDNDLVSLCRGWAGAEVHGAGAGPGLSGGEASAGSHSANAEVPVTEGPEEGNKRSQFKRSCSFILQHSEYSHELVHLCELAHRH
jgi:hypothetical protein